jgi:hypothetical protein
MSQAVIFSGRAGKETAKRQATKLITGWIQEGLHACILEELQIMVTEVECKAPDCVPIETLVIFLSKNSRHTHKILKPLAEVTKDDIEGMKIPLNIHFLKELSIAESIPSQEIGNDNLFHFTTFQISLIINQNYHIVTFNIYTRKYL